jgi:hypothetical protein
MHQQKRLIAGLFGMSFSHRRQSTMKPKTAAHRSDRRFGVQYYPCDTF